MVYCMWAHSGPSSYFLLLWTSHSPFCAGRSGLEFGRVVVGERPSGRQRTDTRSARRGARAQRLVVWLARLVSEAAAYAILTLQE